MAATRLLSELSIFVLIAAAGATTAQTPDVVSARCFNGNGPGDQLAQAVQIKKSLIQDLIAKLPDRSEPYYCNELTLDGLKMNGYAECRLSGQQRRRQQEIMHRLLGFGG
ncbi:unnamed protein product [Linum trigynum]|uniref:Uncharacterized protein n=1 Tax=Linum trigynum TaxID=586398 RepID=A0AAV2G1L0_9ROSI